MIMNQRIKKLIEEGIKLSSDSKRDNEIVRLLREIDSFEALEIIKSMVNRESPNAYYVACKVLNERKVAEPFFIYGLSKADASTIKLWLEFAIPRIGLKKIIAFLKNKENQNSYIIDKALYWLPSLVESKDLQHVDELKRWWGKPF